MVRLSLNTLCQEWMSTNNLLLQYWPSHCESWFVKLLKWQCLPLTSYWDISFCSCSSCSV
jgi:hypothetical protein